jgi:predicted dehydrogenase
MAGLTVGIIGLGYGRAHISGFQANGCQVVALCQRDEASARKVADAYGVPHVFGRWEEMLERARPEIVVIATPPHLHLAVARAAFARGAHVLCEKPVAMTTAEARAMVEDGRRAGRVAMTGFNWRFTAAMQTLHAMAASGEIGRVFHLAGRWLGGRMAGGTAPASWRMDRAQAAHGAMGDMGVHLVDIIRWNFGEFRRVVARSGIAYPGRELPGLPRSADAEDWCIILGELENGTHVTLTASRAAHGANEHALEVYGATAAVRYRLTRDGSRWWAGDLAASQGGAFTPVEPRVPVPASEGGDAADAIGRTTIAPLVARFLEGIRTGTTPSPSLEEGLRAQVVLDAAVESVQRNDWVDVAA